MVEVLHDRITGPSAWVGPEIQNETSWIRTLSPSAQEEIDGSLRQVEARRLTIPFGKEDFPLDSAAGLLDEVPAMLEDGQGFVLVRGIDRSRYTAAQCELIYWGIGVHLGIPISQNTRGHLLGHVRDEGKSFDDANVRGYQTRAKMDFHADQLPVDVLGLFCVRAARSGGSSALVSVDAVHNVVLEERPDLLEVLYQPFNLDWRGEE
ncbi:MAG: TauD/TfdA family dioxygenase, partial [Acidimicrobiia bacterium]|nr:TauD/TfdA family dioxygenase [Acidimicrobiia bacterium]